MRTHTYTFALLEVSAPAFDEIAAKLNEAGYTQAFSDGKIDMHGLALVPFHQPPGVSYPGRPSQIDDAIYTLREVALTHRSASVSAQLLDVCHHMARLERLVQEKRQPTRWEQFKAWWTDRRNAGAAAGRRIRR